MAEKKTRITPVETVRIDLLCDKCDSIMVAKTDNLLAINPAQYLHTCKKCLHTQLETEIYPLIRYRPINSKVSDLSPSVNWLDEQESVGLAYDKDLLDAELCNIFKTKEIKTTEEYNKVSDLIQQITSLIERLPIQNAELHKDGKKIIKYVLSFPNDKIEIIESNSQTKEFRSITKIIDWNKNEDAIYVLHETTKQSAETAQKKA